MVETFFTEKGIIKKIVIVLIFIFMFNFTFSYLGNNVVLAADSGDSVTDKYGNSYMEEGGGKLLIPIAQLLLFVADAALQIMQTSFITESSVIIKAASDSTKDISGGIALITLAVVGVVVGAVTFGVGAVAVYSAGAAAVGLVATTTAVIGALGGTAGTMMLVGGVVVAGGIYAGTVGVDKLEGEFDLPYIIYTPESIFANRIPSFDINFFNPANDVIQVKKIKTVEETTYTYAEELVFDVPASVNSATYYAINFYPDEMKSLNVTITKEHAEHIMSEILKIQNDIVAAYDETVDVIGNDELSKHWEEARNVFKTADVEFAYSQWDRGKIDEKTPYELISKMDYYINIWNKALSAYQGVFEAYKKNFTEEQIEQLTKRTPIPHHEIVEKEVADNIYKSSAAVLQSTVASIYKVLRVVALVALLSILIYVGIRIVLSSASKDKAKYKQMLIDWLVAFILLFVLHYIMAFIIDISENLTNICNKSNIENLTLELPPDTTIIDPSTNDKVILREKVGVSADQTIGWGTNFMGYVRYKAGLILVKGYTIRSLGFLLMYLVMVIYVVMFTFQYLRRVLYIAFLTMIAPIVAITYPLDKINDGKAQGFNMWLKEYIFNALLQPIHYIIYIIIMGSVMNLVIDQPIYALVALGFMVPAEKFIRKMFGFEKASTVGNFGAAAGAAALMGGLQKLRHSSHKKGNDDNGAKGDKDNPSGKVRTISAMPPKKEIGDNIAEKGIEAAGNAVIPGAGTVATKVGEGVKNVTDTIVDGVKLPQEGDSNFIGPVRPQEGDSNFIGPMRPQEGDSNFIGPMRPQEGDSNFIGPQRPPQEGEFNLDSPDEYMSEAELMSLAYDVPGGTNITPTNVEPPPVQTPNSYVPPVRTSEPTIVPDTSSQNQEKPSILNRARNSAFGRGMQAVGGHYTRRLENRLRKAHPLRALRRGLTFGAGALTLGTIGLAAGIASGDPSKALQYTTAAGMVGGHLGQNLGETASNIAGLEGATKAFKAGALGSKYDEIERAKYKRDFKRNVSNYDAGVKNVTAAGWREMSEDGGIIDTALDYGITNIDDMSNIYKTQKKFMEERGLGKEEAQDLAFKAYKLDEKFGDYSSNSKTQENLEKLLIARGYTDEAEREKVTNGMLSTMRTYQNVSLDDQIQEPEFDYTRMAGNPTQVEEAPQQVATDTQTVPDSSTRTEGRRGMPINLQLFAEKGTAGTRVETTSSPSTSDSVRTVDSNDSEVTPYNFSTTTGPIRTENSEDVARRANAESDANKAQAATEAERRRKAEEMDTLKKNIEERDAERVKAERKRKKETKKQQSKVRAEEQKQRRKAIQEKGNNDSDNQDGPQSSSTRGSRGKRRTNSNSSEGATIRTVRTKEQPIITPSSSQSSSQSSSSQGPVTSDNGQTNVNPVNTNL